MTAGAADRTVTGASDPHAQGRRLIIAVDGPSGSGKSSVCRAAARRLGAAYLDTGAMYRAATWYCLDRGVDLDDEAAVAVAVEELPLTISTDPDHQTVTVGQCDVTQSIREARISESVSEISTNRAARALLVAAQRRIIDQAGIRRGRRRDITTVVAPDAQVRVLLTASAEVRLARRGLQMGGGQSAEALQRQVLARDARDSTAVNFTEAADGVAVLDSSDLTFEETVEALVSRVKSVR
ncbi:(d)CMP kinase [Nesterenkonia sp. PF2B19]|uniref:(d)CMP kinase n=1 Tax=Nesterenkonia sp. PF2B19 TaxID=1881858 RepID=UPI000871BB8F|nr:(d)CMP kinase [Nesterenkonia sp. PF2B19]OSM42892.1 cytidylate kinase [Nesterenkonia sp. PF2B19]